MSSPNPKYKLIYFNIMGIAEPVRLLFALANVEYEDARISKEEWAVLKDKTPWGKVPVLEEDGHQICQSLTILRYLGRKFGLGGSTELETALCGELLDTMNDIRLEWMKHVLEKDETKKPEIEKRLREEVMPRFLGKLTKLLQENGTGTLVGKSLTYGDLHVAHFLQRVMVYWDGETGEDHLKNYPEIKKHQETVFNHPGIKAYIEKRPVTEK